MADPESVTEALRLALAHYQAGSWERAAHICSRVLERAPRSVEALNLMGLAACELGDGDRALDCVRRAVALAPERVEFRFNLANLCLRAGDLDDAVTGYRDVLAQEPGNAGAHLNLGTALQRQGRLDDAVASFLAAVDAAPAAAGYYNLGNALTEQGRLDEAVAGYQRALTADPDLAPAHNNLGDALRAQGRYDSAAGSYRRALELDPGMVSARANLGATLLEQGRVLEAIPHLEEAQTLAPDDPVVRRSLARARAWQLPAWHFPMLADGARNGCYARAIEKAVAPGSHVLDIGTGSGLLALMAARAGAELVTACEMSAPLAAVARQVVADNGYADRIAVVAKKSTALRLGEDMPRPADVVVSEILDVGLLGEGVLPTMRHALRELAAPDAAVIPRGATVCAVLLEIPARRAVNPVARVEGFDLSAFDRFRVPGDCVIANLASEPHRALSEPFTVVTFDFVHPPPAVPETSPRQSLLEVAVSQTGTLQAVGYWFDLHLDEAITASTGPGGELTCWGQALQFLDRDEPVRDGERLRLAVHQDESRLAFSLAPR